MNSLRVSLLDYHINLKTKDIHLHFVNKFYNVWEKILA